MAFNDLPPVNKRLEKSEEMSLRLRSLLFECIKDFESQHNYQFEPYELDLIFLAQIKRHHESYLRMKFKNA